MDAQTAFDLGRFLGQNDGTYVGRTQRIEFKGGELFIFDSKTGFKDMLRRLRTAGYGGRGVLATRVSDGGNEESVEV